MAHDNEINFMMSAKSHLHVEVHLLGAPGQPTAKNGVVTAIFQTGKITYSQTCEAPKDLKKYRIKPKTRWKNGTKGFDPREARFRWCMGILDSTHQLRLVALHYHHYDHYDHHHHQHQQQEQLEEDAIFNHLWVNVTWRSFLDSRYPKAPYSKPPCNWQPPCLKLEAQRNEEELQITWQGIEGHHRLQAPSNWWTPVGQDSIHSKVRRKKDELLVSQA